MIREIHTVAVTVSDKKKAADWYVQKLGFELRSETQEHWVVVGPKNAPASLHLCEMPGKLEPGNTGVLLSCDDLEKTVAELKKAGVAFTHEITKEPWGVYAMIKDPDGNEYWLMS